MAQGSIQTEGSENREGRGKGEAWGKSGDEEGRVLTHQYRQISQGHLCKIAWTCRTAWLPQHRGCVEVESGRGWREELSAGLHRKRKETISPESWWGYEVCLNRTIVTVFHCLIWVSPIYNRAHTSLHTSMVPNTTCRPSKKLSPMMMTVAPPVVHPSLGLIALMHGVAAYPRQRKEQIQHLSLNAQAHVSFHKDTSLHRLYAQLSMSHTKTYHGNCP